MSRRNKSEETVLMSASEHPLVLAIQEKFGVTLDKVQEYGQHTVPPGVVPIRIFE
jgi:hypothetical protein